MVKFSFITTPVIDYKGIILHRNCRIFFNGNSKKNEIWSKSEDEIDIALDDFIMVMQDYDPKIEIKLLAKIGGVNKNWGHPSNANWAYSKIPLNKFSTLSITDQDIRKIKRKLKKFKSDFC